MPRSLTTWILLSLAFLTAVVATFIGITTALGWAHADVRGYRLTGSLEALFLTGLALAAVGAVVAAIGLWLRRAWAVSVFAAIWPVFALICLLLDRITPAPGPGRPLWFYLIIVGLLPAAATLSLRTGPRTDGMGRSGT